jgi:hypothetical protein
VKTELLVNKISIVLTEAQQDLQQASVDQLKIYLQANLGSRSRVLDESDSISPRTEPEGASALGLNEIIILFSSGAGLAIIQQTFSLLVEWLKAKKQSTVSIEVDECKIIVSGEAHPDELALKLFKELESERKKRRIILPE